jgi:hypothetical protein
MVHKLLCTTALIASTAGLIGSAGTAHGQCASCGVPAVAYQPATYAQPVAYQTGWYPGYLLDRIGASLWGQPRTYVAAYPASYSVGYAPTYQTVAHQVALTSYSSCATCGCNPCGCQSVVMRPVTCCDPCSTCACSPCTCGDPCGCSSCADGCDTCAGGCGTGTASPAVYAAPSNCPSCATPAGTSSSAPASAPRTFYEEPQPELSPDANPAPQTYGPGSQGDSPTSGDSYGSGTNSASYLEAPRLFNPRDRTTQRTPVPVRAAIYEKSPGEVSTAVIPTSVGGRQRAELAARAWTAVAE